MRKILLMGVILFSVILCSGQQDAKAKEILEKVTEKTNSLKSISADFIFTLQNKEMDINERNSGTIKIKGQKYNVDLPDVGMRVISDGKVVWNYMKEGNQVTISSIEDEASELMSPSALFSIYEKDFTPKFVSEKKEGTRTVYHIDLFPGKKEQEVTKISIGIDKETLMIHSALLYADGNQYGIDVLKMETNREIPDSEFSFDASKYKDIEVIDLR